MRVWQGLLPGWPGLFQLLNEWASGCSGQIAQAVPVLLTELCTPVVRLRQRRVALLEAKTQHPIGENEVHLQGRTHREAGTSTPSRSAGSLAVCSSSVPVALVNVTIIVVLRSTHLSGVQANSFVNWSGQYLWMAMVQHVRFPVLRAVGGRCDRAGGQRKITAVLSD